MEAHSDQATPRPLSARVEYLSLTLLIVIAVTRVIMTYSVFSEVVDEPHQIAGGMQWIDQHAFMIVPSNPPLPRILFALGPYLDGARFVTTSNPIDSGNAILYSGDYTRRLSLARTGNLPFLVLAIVVVWSLTRRLFGQVEALLAAALFTLLPEILGNAGLATTDLAIAATLGATILVLVEWLDRPTVSRTIALGGTIAMTILSKFSAFLFLPASAAVLVGFHLLARGRNAPTLNLGLMRLAGRAALLVASTCLIIWAGYFCSWLPASRDLELVLPDSALRPAFDLLQRTGMPLPAPGFIAGVTMLFEINRRPNFPSYFMGGVHRTGHVLYYPVLVAVKTPIPYLLLGLAGSVLFVRCRLQMPWAAPALGVAGLAILMVSMSFRINSGSRHILPIYVLLAPPAGAAALHCWRAWRTVGPTLIALLIGSMLASSVASHPDYLAYFNFIAGKHPERISVTADLDWGQDLFRIREAVEAYRVDRLWLAYFGSAIPPRHDLGVPIRMLPPGRKVHGWIAVSEVFRHPIWTGGYLWLNAYQPVAQIGKSIWLYRIP